MPHISIIVPIYNVENYLDRCMQSLLNQTLKDIEIILIDDGSTDNCPQICDNYAKLDSRIKVIHKKNGGLGYARNSGLEIATGKYIAFLDSDDYVSTNMYELLYEYATKRNNDIIFCGFRKEYKPKKYSKISECDKYIEVAKEKIEPLILDFIASPPYSSKEYIHDMSVWHSIYRRDIIEKYKIRFVSERNYVSEDILFQIDVLSHCEQVAFIPHILYYYCYNKGSLTKKFNISKFSSTKNLFYLLLEKTQYIDNSQLRVMRLFIGYVRFMIRQIVSLPINHDEKSMYIKSILYDDIWHTIKKRYHTRYLPLHQRIMLLLIYNKSIKYTYIYAQLMNIASICKP